MCLESFFYARTGKDENYIASIINICKLIFKTKNAVIYICQRHFVVNF